MPVPRLSPSANSLTVPVTVNKRLRPYFEIWFQRKRQDGETPEHFALRMLKTAAMNDYYADTAKPEMESYEVEKIAKIKALQEDIDLMDTEVD